MSSQYYVPEVYRNIRNDLSNSRRKETRTSRILIAAFVSLLLILLFSISIFGSNESVALTETNFRTCSITVKKGDTLWSIAKEYAPDIDTRKVIYDIESLNDEDLSVIYSGMIIELPVY